MSFDAQREKVMEIASAILEEGTVGSVIGYKAGGIEGMRIPYIFEKPVDAEALCWDQRCAPNLSTYAYEKRDKRVGIIAKPCDARGIALYIAEDQLAREDVFIIGVDCEGMIDADGEKLPGCAECNDKKPPIFDVRVESNSLDEEYCDEDGKGSQASDFDKFQQEIEKCILCYSCRQACPGCYCPVCFMERGVPNWQPKEPGAGAKMTYHLGRAMHLSGRCVECGACERVCASGVDVRYLIKETTGFVSELYGFRAGFDPDADPVLASYNIADREIGFMGGEENE